MSVKFSGSARGGQLNFLLFLAVGALAFANGANDNFKGVATLWGAGRSTYGKALAWATAFTMGGSLAAIWAARGLAAKFNGSKFLASDIYTQAPFLIAVAAGAGATVLLAARWGLPISTTHALTGALLGAGGTAAGVANVKFAALGSGVVWPLLASPIASLLLTVSAYSVYRKLAGSGPPLDCVCVEAAQMQTVAPAGAMAAAVVVRAAEVKVANRAECSTGTEVARFEPADALHWLSGAGISFARGLNDTPKIAALLLVTLPATTLANYAWVALAMAVGGALGAVRIAQTMSKGITPMATGEAVTANLVAAGLVTAASFWALPVSTTHVTSGGIFGIGLLRHNEADWRRVQDILLSWVGTLPLGAALAAGLYWLLGR